MTQTGNLGKLAKCSLGLCQEAHGSQGDAQVGLASMAVWQSAVVRGFPNEARLGDNDAPMEAGLANLANWQIILFGVCQGLPACEEVDKAGPARKFWRGFLLFFEQDGKAPQRTQKPLINLKGFLAALIKELSFN